MSEPVFAEPWEAQVFALVTSLRESGVFTAAEWAGALGAEIRSEGQPERVADYARWLGALETLLAGHGVTDGGEVGRRSAAFLRAAAATPHGAPIRIENDPLHEG